MLFKTNNKVLNLSLMRIPSSLGANVGIFNIRCVAAPSPCPMWVQVAFCMVGYLVTVAGYLGQVCWSRCGQIWAAPPSAFA